MEMLIRNQSSLRAGLWQPYLHLPISHPALSGPGIDPLQRMKDGARQVAMSVSDVMQNKKSDAIPTWLFVILSPSLTCFTSPIPS